MKSIGNGIWWMQKIESWAVWPHASPPFSWARRSRGTVIFLDTGDFLIVVNAEKIMLTGNKWEDKIYYSHSGYSGGLKEIRAKDLRSKHPERLMRFAVKGMLPKNKLGRKMLKKLKGLCW